MPCFDTAVHRPTATSGRRLPASRQLQQLEPVVSTIRRIRGLGSGFCYFSDLKCDQVFTLYPDGRLGSCDELPWPQAQLTRLDQADDPVGIIAAQWRLPLLNPGKDLMGQRTSCDYRSACGGGCITTGSSRAGAQASPSMSHGCVDG
ncbi:hypothetical protein [Streptomyces sp. NPDC048641]|uniref:hypothetical protein n=1 Tax=Streptomyces sp. NPDC048641 TaxID=3154825 RepID=UPI0034408156